LIDNGEVNPRTNLYYLIIKKLLFFKAPVFPESVSIFLQNAILQKLTTSFECLLTGRSFLNVPNQRMAFLVTGFAAYNEKV